MDSVYKKHSITSCSRFLFFDKMTLDENKKGDVDMKVHERGFVDWNTQKMISIEDAMIELMKTMLYFVQVLNDCDYDDMIFINAYFSDQIEKNLTEEQFHKYEKYYEIMNMTMYLEPLIHRKSCRCARRMKKKSTKTDNY